MGWSGDRKHDFFWCGLIIIIFFFNSCFHSLVNYLHFFTCAQIGGKRGRPCAWEHLHRERGKCRLCVLCKRPSEQGRYTHTAFWRKGDRDKLAQLGVKPTSCICQSCHVSKIKTGALFRNRSTPAVAAPTPRKIMHAVSGRFSVLLRVRVCVCHNKK